MLQQWINNQKVRLWVPPIAGFLFYGAWATVINYSHGLQEALTAGLTQGGYSFTITLFLAIIVEWLFVRLSHLPYKSVWVFVLALLLLLVTSIGINLFTGTPEVLLTVLPGLLISSIYTLIYIMTLNKLGQ